MAPDLKGGGDDIVHLHSRTTSEKEEKYPSIPKTMKTRYMLGSGEKYCDAPQQFFGRKLRLWVEEEEEMLKWGGGSPLETSSSSLYSMIVEE